MIDLHEVLLAARLAAQMGGGGTTDYTALTNKPSINGKTLEGDTSLAQLGILSAEILSETAYSQLATKDKDIYFTYD